MCIAQTHFHCGNLHVRMVGNQQSRFPDTKLMQTLSQRTQHVFNTKINWWWQKLSTKHFVKKKPWCCVQKVLCQLHCFAVWSSQIKLSVFTQHLRQNHWKRGLENRFGSLQLKRCLLPVQNETLWQLFWWPSQKLLATGWFWAIKELKTFRDHDWRFKKFWKGFPENVQLEMPQEEATFDPFSTHVIS